MSPGPKRPGPKRPGQGQHQPARTNDPAPDLVVVGRIGKPHGVRGEVCVHSHAQDPELFHGLERVHLLAPDSRPKAGPGVRSPRARTLAILSWRDQGKHLVMRFSGVDDRDQAAALTNLDLAVAEADLPEPDEDEIYLHEIMGFAVHDTQGNDLGRLERFIESPGQEVWAVRHPSGKEILLPAVEEIILEIDPDREQIMADPPPGLVELYLEDQPEKKSKPDKPTS